jgi:hypothetical protein
MQDALAIWRFVPIRRDFEFEEREVLPSHGVPPIPHACDPFSSGEAA